MYMLSFLLRRIFEAHANNERLIEAITWLTIGCSPAEMLVHAQGLAGLFVCLFVSYFPSVRCPCTSVTFHTDLAFFSFFLLFFFC